jgi:hypothetical protein
MSKRRFIAYTFVGFFVITAIFFFFKACRMRQEYNCQLATRPLDISVDFSNTSVFTAPFPQTCQACCGQAIYLQVPVNSLRDTSPSNLLASLKFKWEIINSKGKVVSNNDCLPNRHFDEKLDDGLIPLSYLASFNSLNLTNYTFNCTVISGAPALSGVDQRLIWKYRPCNIKMAFVNFCLIIGIAALITAGILLLLVRTRKAFHAS